jgi:hypothetical protein
MNINGREFVLAEVSRGMGHIGVFRYATSAYNTTDAFYIENDPIIRIFNPYTPDKNSDKQITQISGAEKCSDAIKARITSSAENLFRYSQGLARSAIPVLELLTPGLYVVHESQMHPGDGNGSFFWNNYAVKKPVKGTADKNASIGDANFSPCFLIPTMTPSSFQPKRMYDLTDKIKSGRRLGGVAYHISGMFSALLEGHHEATAALMNNVDFRCLVVEPLTDVIYDSSDSSGGKQKVIALSSPYINIPLEELSEKALERFLITRKQVKPNSFSEIKPKMTKSIRMVSKRVFPSVVYEKAEQLPSCAMVEASSAVDAVTDEQLAALLAGEVRCADEEGNEKIIVSSNYHSSVVAVSNYLQTNDFSRFLEFALALLKNDELSTSHKFIAERLLVVMHPAIYEYFLSIVNNSVKKDGIINDTAQIYVMQWEEHTQKQQGDEDSYLRKKKKTVEDMQAITEAKGIATLEAAVRSIGDMPRGM